MPASGEQVSPLCLQSSSYRCVLYRTQWFCPIYNMVGEVTWLISSYFYYFGVFFGFLLLPTSCMLAPSLLNLCTRCKELHMLRGSMFLHTPPTQLQRWTCYGAFQIIRNPHTDYMDWLLFLSCAIKIILATGQHKQSCAFYLTGKLSCG